MAAAVASRNRAHAEVGDAPTTAMLRGAKNSARRLGVTGEPGSGSVSREPGLTAVICYSPRLPPQPERSLAGDVALDLAFAPGDGPCPARQEYVLPGAGRVARAVRPGKRLPA